MNIDMSAIFATFCDAGRWWFVDGKGRKRGYESEGSAVRACKDAKRDYDISSKYRHLAKMYLEKPYLPFTVLRLGFLELGQDRLSEFFLSPEKFERVCRKVRAVRTRAIFSAAAKHYGSEVKEPNRPLSLELDYDCRKYVQLYHDFRECVDWKKRCDELNDNVRHLIGICCELMSEPFRPIEKRGMWEWIAAALGVLNTHELADVMQSFFGSRDFSTMRAKLIGAFNTEKEKFDSEISQAILDAREAGECINTCNELPIKSLQGGFNPGLLVQTFLYFAAFDDCYSRDDLKAFVSGQKWKPFWDTTANESGGAASRATVSRIVSKQAVHTHSAGSQMLEYATVREQLMARSPWDRKPMSDIAPLGARVCRPVGGPKS